MIQLRSVRLDSCGECEECREGFICPDVVFARCCLEEIDEAISSCLDDFSEGMASPDRKSYLSFAIAHAIAGHQCDA